MNWFIINRIANAAAWTLIGLIQALRIMVMAAQIIYIVAVRAIYGI